MPRIGIINGGDVIMPQAIQAFQKQMESTPEVAPSDNS
jgi:hypothetical protein